jgi:hypothetical protein
LALTSLTSGGGPVGIVRSRTQATEFSFLFSATIAGTGLHRPCMIHASPQRSYSQVAGPSLYRVAVSVLATASETPRPRGRTLSTQSIQFIQRSAPTHDRKRAPLKGCAFVDIANTANTAVTRNETRVDPAGRRCLVLDPALRIETALE